MQKTFESEGISTRESRDDAVAKTNDHPCAANVNLRFQYSCHINGKV